MTFLALLALSATGFVDRGAHRIHYEAMGSGKPMVAIPGGPGFSGRALWSVGWEFQDACQVILFDQLGTGLSRMKDGSRPVVSLKRTVADLEALRQHLGFKKWTVFGQSWGAIVAVAYALEHPTRVEGLVLASIPGFRDADYPVLTTNLMLKAGPERMAEIQAAAMRAKTPAEAAATQVLGLTPYYFADVEAGQQLADRAPARLFDGQTFLDLYPEIGDATFAKLRQRARGWKGRALIVQGHQDPCGAAMPFLLAQWLPNCEVKLIDGAGHFSFIEKPYAFASAVRPFIGVPMPTHYRYQMSPEAEAWRAKSEAAGWPFGARSSTGK